MYDMHKSQLVSRALRIEYPGRIQGYIKGSSQRNKLLELFCLLFMACADSYKLSSCLDIP